VIQRKYEKGIVTYCGVYGEQDFTDALAAKLATQSNLPARQLPPRVQLLKRGVYRILLNYSLQPIDAPAPPRTRFVVGTRKVDPAGVAVWKEA
jgi:beta-galactosidase